MGEHRGNFHSSVAALAAKILTEEAPISHSDREARYQRVCKIVACRVDDPTDRPDGQTNNITPPRQAALHARRHLMPLEARFFSEAHTRWPGIRFRRYAPVSIVFAPGERPSVSYAPFLCRPKKLIIVIEDRRDFPYRIYGRNRDLYAQHGYTVLDFSEDFSTPWDESVWRDAMAMINEALCAHRQAA